MADTVTTQTIADTSGVKFTVKLTNLSDGTGETLVKKVDASETTFMTEDGNRKISKVWYTINTANGKSAVELLFDAASDEGITAYQVGNLIKASGFQSDINSAIGTFGGCEQIISRFILRKGRSKRSLTGEERFDSDIYYGPDAANEFAQFNELNP